MLSYMTGYHIFDSACCGTYHLEFGFLYSEDLSVCALCYSPFHFCPENETSNGFLWIENAQVYTFWIVMTIWTFFSLEILNTSYWTWHHKSSTRCDYSFVTKSTEDKINTNLNYTSIVQYKAAFLLNSLFLFCVVLYGAKKTPRGKHQAEESTIAHLIR